MDADLLLKPCIRCKQPVAVTRATVEFAELFNRHLAERGQAPLADHELVSCDDCRAWLEEERSHAAQCDEEREALLMARWRCGEISLAELPADLRRRRHTEIRCFAAAHQAAVAGGGK